MYAEKFELLEAKIRETAMLVSRLREEKRQLEWENEQLRAHVAELKHNSRARKGADRYEPDLDHLLEQLDARNRAKSRPGCSRLPRPPRSPRDTNRHRLKTTCNAACSTNSKGNTSQPFTPTNAPWRLMRTWKPPSVWPSCLRSSIAMPKQQRCGTGSGPCERNSLAADGGCVKARCIRIQEETQGMELHYRAKSQLSPGPAKALARPSLKSWPQKECM